MHVLVQWTCIHLILCNSTSYSMSFSVKEPKVHAIARTRVCVYARNVQYIYCHKFIYHGSYFVKSSVCHFIAIWNTIYVYDILLPCHSISMHCVQLLISTCLLIEVNRCKYFSWNTKNPTFLNTNVCECVYVIFLNIFFFASDGLYVSVKVIFAVRKKFLLYLSVRCYCELYVCSLLL